MKKTLTLLLACLLPVTALAQDFPTKPIRFIVPFTTGTGMDTIARTVQPRLSERLGVPVVVQNMPGASGNIGADFVARFGASSSTGFGTSFAQNTRQFGDSSQQFGQSFFGSSIFQYRSV